MTMARDVTGLALLLAGSGVLHLFRPEPYEKIVPKPLPRKRELVYVSGIAELACAAALSRESTRPAAGWATAALMLAVFPANVQMTVSGLRSDKAPTWYKVGLVARLPLQLPLVRTAVKAARSSR